MVRAPHQSYLSHQSRAFIRPVQSLQPQRGAIRPAQGNALGLRLHTEQALKGRIIRRVIRPFRAGHHTALDTQGVALGWPNSPRWG